MFKVYKGILYRAYNRGRGLGGLGGRVVRQSCRLTRRDNTCTSSWVHLTGHGSNPMWQTMSPSVSYRPQMGQIRFSPVQISINFSKNVLKSDLKKPQEADLTHIWDSWFEKRLRGLIGWQEGGLDFPGQVFCSHCLTFHLLTTTFCHSVNYTDV